MPSQVVAAATQFRKASGLDELEELDELDDDPHMPISACRQLELVRELVLDVDIPKHVWHLAMMLSTALSHLDVALGQPVTDSTDNTNAMKAIFMCSVYPRSSWPHTPQYAVGRWPSIFAGGRRVWIEREARGWRRDPLRIESGLVSGVRARYRRVLRRRLSRYRVPASGWRRG